jgi:transposase
MIALASPIRMLLYRRPTDMRKSFNGLIALTESELKQDPVSESLFVFVNRRRDRTKILNWGQTAFCIGYEQLQKGTYQLPDTQSPDSNTLQVARSQLSLILDGTDLSSARQRTRFDLERHQRAPRVNT